MAAEYRMANTDSLREYRRAYHKEHRERRNAESRRYADEHRDRLRALGRQYRAANPEKDRDWRVANPEAVREAQRRYRTAHPEVVREQRARRRAVIAEATTEDFTVRDLRHDWEDHDFYGCFFCGGPLSDGYEVEHFYPLRPLKGSGVPQGPHAVWNLLPSCAPCNRGAGGKGSKEPWQFLRESLAEQGVDLGSAIATLEAIAARRRR
ncbi:HNH endonuclease [Streptomyces sp. NPDC096057]|uniref:HNH endonuclease signature motif containing protein n=1 Tax=Streptomyces sp. NPDC096057 TaxID=3155543 RepID=UPI00332DBE64